MGHLNVDFRQREIRLLETEGSAKSLKVKKLVILDTLQEGIEMFEDESIADSISETLGRVLSKERFTRDPAGMALVGERVDVGIRFFNPVREADISTSAFACPGAALLPFPVRPGEGR